MHTNGASDASVSVRLGGGGKRLFPLSCTMYTLEYHHRCIHSVVVIVESTLPRTPQSTPLCRLSCWLVAHKTHSSKSTNGFRYEMHETDRQTYCAAFLPHRVRVPPSCSLPTLITRHCATYIRSHNQLAIFLLTPTLPLARYLCCPLWYAIWAAAPNAVSINHPPPPILSRTPFASTPLRTEAIWHCWSSFYEKDIHNIHMRHTNFASRIHLYFMQILEECHAPYPTLFLPCPFR